MHDPIMAGMLAIIAGTFIFMGVGMLSLIGIDIYLVVRGWHKERKERKAEFVRKLKGDPPDWATVENIMGIKIESIIIDGKAAVDLEVCRQVEKKVKRAMLASLK